MSGQDPLQVFSFWKIQKCFSLYGTEEGQVTGPLSPARKEDLPRFKPCHNMSLHSLRTAREGWEREAKMSKRQLLPARTSQSTEVSAMAWECGPSYRKSQEPQLGKSSWSRWAEAAPQQLSGVAKIPVLPEKEELGDGFHQWTLATTSFQDLC